jgi:Xaa-Pro aminopeptidase
MRRGLMSWSRQEMPVAQLDARLARLQAAMREAELDALLAYTSFAQPSAVHWVTHFTPYWSEALLVVRPEGAPVLLAALTKRVHPWIREVSHLQEAAHGAAPGHRGGGAAGQHGQLQAKRPSAWAWWVWMTCLGRWPSRCSRPIPVTRLVDASALFAAVRQPADAAELGLARQALAKAQAALSMPWTPCKAQAVHRP